MVILDPGQAQMNYTQLTLPIVDGPDMINGGTVRRFDVEGHPTPYAYAAVCDQGVTSALGIRGVDVFPADPHLVHITLPEVADGQSIRITFEENVIPDGTLVTWVLGELEEAL